VELVGVGGEVWGGSGSRGVGGGVGEWGGGEKGVEGGGLGGGGGGVEGEFRGKSVDGEARVPSQSLRQTKSTETATISGGKGPSPSEGQTRRSPQAQSGLDENQ